MKILVQKYRLEGFGNQKEQVLLIILVFKLACEFIFVQLKNS